MQLLHVAVIGCSGMAEAHMKAVRDHRRAVLTAVCDIDAAKAERVAGEFGVPFYVDYRAMLADALAGKVDIEAVIIVTPDQLHREMVETCLEAGMHILCEKPLALTRDDCAAIVRAGDAHPDRVLMVGQICRYTPGFAKAKALIDRGEIGELYFVESEYAHDYAHILHAGGWRSDPLRHGVVGGGCHAVDLLRWVAGDPVEVNAYANRFCLPDQPYDDCTVAILRFGSGCIGKVFCSTGCKRNYTMRSCFYGTKGTIITDNTSPEMTVFKTTHGESDRILGREAQSTPVKYPLSINNHNTVGEFAEFASLVLDGGEVKTDAREGAKTVAACLGIVQSATEGHAVQIDYNF